MSGPARIGNRALSDLERGEGRDLYESLPRQIQIEPTNRCNLSCRSCARNVYDARLNQPADFSLELLQLVRPLFATAEEVLLGGYGEPLLAPLFLEIAAAAKSAGAGLSVVTNGVLIDSAMAGAMAALPADEVILSVDAATDKGLVEARGVSIDALHKTVEALNRARGGGPPELILQSVLSSQNINELAGLVRLADQWGASRLRAVHQKIYDPRQAEWSLLDKGELAEQTFEEAASLARESGVSIELPALQGTSECVMPLEMLMVRADGMVLGCCSAAFGGSRFTLELGSAYRVPLIELWNAPLMRQYRRAAAGRGEFPGPCRSCAFRVMDAKSHQRHIRNS